MCHSDASRPPSAEGAVPAASDSPLELTSTDGTRVLAHQARPVHPTGVGVVVLPDVRGLYRFYEELALRVAERGHAAVAALRERGATRIFTVGFCFGGALSWRQSADTEGLAGCVGFYGRPERVADAVDRMRAPLLMLVAGADANIPVADAERLAEQAAQRVPVRLEVFEGAPHSFFDRSFAEHEQACARAWALVREFLGL